MSNPLLHMDIKKLTFFVIIIVLSGFYVKAQTEVFRNDEGSHPCYRIPAITKAKNGDIVAFVEGRRTMHDHAHNDLVIRRSADNGKSWSKYQVIFRNENVMVNPSPVTLHNGEILIFIEEFPNGYHARAGGHMKLLSEGFGEGSQKLWMLRSSDHGKTWSDPLNLTKISRGAVGKMLTSGSPAASIQLKYGRNKGRILVPMYCTTWNSDQRYNYSSVLISDDNGKTWIKSSDVENMLPLAEVVGTKGGSCNEFHIAQLSDNKVVINARGNDGGRYYSISTNGGETWTKYAKIMSGRTNNNALVALPIKSKKNILVYTQNGDPKYRRHGELYTSMDGVEYKKIIDLTSEAAEFGYSALTILENGNVGLLYESFEKDNKCIRFVEIEKDIILN